MTKHDESGGIDLRYRAGETAFKGQVTLHIKKDQCVDEGDRWAVTLDMMAMLQGLLLSEVAPEGKAVCIMKEDEA